MWLCLFRKTKCICFHISFTISLWTFWSVKVVVALMVNGETEISNFILKYLHLCSKDEWKTYRFDIRVIKWKYFHFWLNCPFNWEVHNFLLHIYLLLLLTKPMFPWLLLYFMHLLVALKGQSIVERLLNYFFPFKRITVCTNICFNLHRKQLNWFLIYSKLV